MPGPTGQLGDINGKQLLSHHPRAATTDSSGNPLTPSKYVIKKISNAGTAVNGNTSTQALAGRLNQILVVMKATGLIHHITDNTKDSTESPSADI